MINKSKLLITFFVAFVFLSELMISVDARITFFLYFFLIVFFLFSFSKAGSLNNDGILASLFLVLPIIRIIQIFLHIDFFWNNLILYLCFLYLSMVCVERFDLKEVFTTKMGHYIVYAMIAGIGIGLVSSNIFSPEKNASLIFLIPLIVFTEELFFRGVVQSFIEERYGRIIGMIFVSLMYGVLSLSQGILTALLFFVFYLIGSIFYTETKNMFVSSGLSLMFHLFFFVFNVY